MSNFAIHHRDRARRPPRRRRLAALVVAVGSVVALGVAGAEPQLKFDPQPPAPTAQDKHPPPSLRVTVIDGPGGLAPEAFALRQTDARLLAVKASSVLRYAEGPEPLGLIVLVEGDARYLTANPNLVPALESSLASLATVGPPGSRAAVWLYGDQVAATPVGSLADLGTVDVVPAPSGEAPVARDLAGAITRAIAELDKLATPRKALLVIGDGIDGPGAKSPSAVMRELGTQLGDKGIVASAVVLQIELPALGAPPPVPVVQDPTTGEELPEDPVARAQFDAADAEWRRIKETSLSDMKSVTNGNAQKMASASNLATAIGMFASLLDDRFYLTFPGFDPKMNAGFTWDGKAHPLVLRIDGQDWPATEVELKPVWSPPGGGSRWWLWGLIGAGVVVGGLVVLLVRRKPKPVPLPSPVAAPPPPGPPAKQKTMFVQMDSESVFPVVGWVVVMNGPKRFTFVKLKQGVTKIGTSPTAEISVDDGYMSTDHALITMSPEGFFLQDNNSANGTFLNDNKVTKREELFDSDLLLLGKTVLKFKAIQ